MGEREKKIEASEWSVRQRLLESEYSNRERESEEVELRQTAAEKQSLQKKEDDQIE